MSHQFETILQHYNFRKTAISIAYGHVHLRLPPRSRWELRSCGLLRSEKC